MPSSILTERFLLRSFELSDLDNVFKGLSDPEVIKYYGVSYSTLKDTNAQMKWFKELEVNRTGQWWAICNKKNTVFFGGIGFNNFQSNHFSAELGLWLLPQFWGSGIMQEVVNSIMSFAISELKLHRMEAIVESENAQCIKGLEKSGFTFEGCRRECEFKNGKFIDLNIYAKIIN